jgi:hypothetical protein
MCRYQCPPGLAGVIRNRFHGLMPMASSFRRFVAEAERLSSARASGRAKTSAKDSPAISTAVAVN